MLTLRLFLIILVTLLCREVCWRSEARIDAMHAVLGITVACIGFGFLAKIRCVLNMRKFGAFNADWHSDWQGMIVHRWQSVRHSLETTWLVCLPVALLLSGWGPWIKQLDELGLLQGVSILLWFVPSLVQLVFLELTTSQMEIYLHERKATEAETRRYIRTTDYEGIDRRGRTNLGGAQATKSASLSGLLRTRLRLGGTSNVMACLLPVVLIATCSDVIKLLGLDWPESIQSLVASFLGLGAVAFFLPQWLSRWMGVTKLGANSLRDRIDVYCRSLRVSVEPKWVSSEGRWAGAAVVGWVPGFRQLWLGDALVEQLSKEEVDMVVMHELAHLVRRHFLWRVIPVLLACAVGIAAVSLFSSSSSLAPSGEYARLAGQVGGMLLASGVMLCGMSYCSRRCELDADRHACLLGAQACPWTGGAVARAADALSSALVKLHHNSIEDSQATWLHPAVRARLRGLRTIQPRVSDRAPCLENQNDHSSLRVVTPGHELSEAVS